MNDPFEIQCAIIVSSNRLIANESFAANYQRENQIIDMPRYWIMRKGKEIRLSYMKSGDYVIFSPLFPKDGHKQIRMTVKEYNRMIRVCPIISDDLFPVSAEVVRAIEAESRNRNQFDEKPKA